MLLPLLWADVFTHFHVALTVSLVLLCVVDGKNYLRVLNPYTLADVTANVAGGKPI